MLIHTAGATAGGAAAVQVLVANVGAKLLFAILPESLLVPQPSASVAFCGSHGTSTVSQKVKEVYRSHQVATTTSWNDPDNKGLRGSFEGPPGLFPTPEVIPEKQNHAGQAGGWKGGRQGVSNKGELSHSLNLGCPQIAC